MLGQRILDQTVDHNERFLVERDGEPAVLIMSVADFAKTLAPTPDWLKDIQEDAKRSGHRERRNRQPLPG